MKYGFLLTPASRGCLPETLAAKSRVGRSGFGRHLWEIGLHRARQLRAHTERAALSFAITIPPPRSGSKHLQPRGYAQCHFRDRRKHLRMQELLRRLSTAGRRGSSPGYLEGRGQRKTHDRFRRDRDILIPRKCRACGSGARADQAAN